MDKKNLLFSLCLVTFLLPACGPSLPSDSGGQTSSQALPGPVAAAKTEIARLLFLTEDEVVVRSVEQKEWPNACLGAQQEDEVCAQVLTPGYRVVLEANGREYIFHTDMTRNVRLVTTDQEGSSATGSGTELPGDTGGY